MKKSKIDDLKKRALDDSLAMDTLYKKVFRSSIIYLSLSLFIVIFSLIFYKTVTYLSMISPLYLMIASTLLSLFLIFILLFSILGYKKVKSDKALKIYNIYDVLSYIWFYIVLIIFILMYFFTPSTVVGNSMNDTLSNGDKVLVWHLGYEAKKDDVVLIHVTKEKYGTRTGGDDLVYIKRVVATSGDKVMYNDYKFYVNDTLVCDSKDSIEESINAYKFMQACGIEEITYTLGNGSKFRYDKESKIIYINDEEINHDVMYSLDDYLKYYGIYNLTGTIKEGYSVCFGDNRDNSTDSRILGLFDNNDILGKAICRFMPFSDFGTLKKKIRYGG